MSYLTFYSWLTSKQNDYKATYFERAYKAGVEKEQALTQAQAKAELATKTLESKISVISKDMVENTEDISKYSNEITKLNTQVQKGEITPEAVKSHDYYQGM